MNFPLPPMQQKSVGGKHEKKSQHFSFFLFCDRGEEKHWIYIFLFVQETKQLTGGDIFGA